MKLLFLLSTVLFIHTTSAQNLDNHDAIIMNFTKGYNYLSPSKIYNLLDEGYKERLTMEKIDQFLEVYGETLGMIEDCRLISKGKGQKSYIMQAEKSYMIMKFEFSEDDKITHYESEVLHASLPTF